MSLPQRECTPASVAQAHRRTAHPAHDGPIRALYKELTDVERFFERAKNGHALTALPVPGVDCVRLHVDRQCSRSSPSRPTERVHRCGVAA